MDGEEFIEKELDCKLSEKYSYVCRLDDHWNEVNEKFGVKEDGFKWNEDGGSCIVVEGVDGSMRWVYWKD